MESPLSVEERTPRSSYPIHYKTKILTDKGEIQISELDDQEVKIWTGFSWKTVHIRKSRSKNELILIKVANGTEEGLELKCTPKHPFYLKYENGSLMVKSGFLLCGMRLLQWVYPSSTSMDQIVRGVEGPAGTKRTYYIEPSGGTCILNGILVGL